MFPVKTDASGAIAHIHSDASVFVHGGAAVPFHLLEALVSRAGELENVRLYHVHLEGEAPWAQPGMERSFQDYSFFIGENVRQAVQQGRADYVPIMLHEIPRALREKAIPLDAALVSVTPPDRHGYVSLGTSVDVALAAVQSAKLVIGQVNDQMPRTGGDCVIHQRNFHFLVEHTEPLPAISPAVPTDAERAISKTIAELIPDGATLQMGIGALPNALLEQLKDHRHLGIHTEMFSDGLIDLLESGSIDNTQKKVLPGRCVASFLYGSRRLYDFVDGHPGIVMKDVSWVNDPTVIARNPKVVAVNSALEIDLTGQVCADSLGVKMYSGVGGQLDFMLGASHSPGGIPVIALPARTRKGVSKIVPQLQLGAGVVTTRANVHWVATEFGAVNLFGKGLKERAKLLASIAHPDDREMLERAFAQRFSAI